MNGQQGEYQEGAPNTVEVKVLSREAIERIQKEAFEAGWIKCRSHFSDPFWNCRTEDDYEEWKNGGNE